MTDSIKKLLGYIQGTDNYSHTNSYRRMRRLGYDVIHRVEKDFTLAVGEVVKPLDENRTLVALIDHEGGLVWHLKKGELYATGGFSGGHINSVRQDGEPGPWLNAKEFQVLESEGVVTIIVGDLEKHIEEDRDD